MAATIGVIRERGLRQRRSDLSATTSCRRRCIASCATSCPTPDRSRADPAQPDADDQEPGRARGDARRGPAADRRCRRRSRRSSAAGPPSGTPVPRDLCRDVGRRRLRPVHARPFRAVVGVGSRWPQATEREIQRGDLVFSTRSARSTATSSTSTDRFRPARPMPTACNCSRRSTGRSRRRSIVQGREPNLRRGRRGQGGDRPEPIRQRVWRDDGSRNRAGDGRGAAADRRERDRTGGWSAWSSAWNRVYSCRTGAAR